MSSFCPQSGWFRKKKSLGNWKLHLFFKRWDSVKERISGAQRHESHGVTFKVYQALHNGTLNIQRCCNVLGCWGISSLRPGRGLACSLAFMRTAGPTRTSGWCHSVPSSSSSGAWLLCLLWCSNPLSTPAFVDLGWSAICKIYNPPFWCWMDISCQQSLIPENSLSPFRM